MGAQTSSEKNSPTRAAWLQFVEKVERGELVDPSGQYLAKTAKAPLDAAGNRLSRPKYDAATPAFAQHYWLKNNGKSLEIKTPIDPINSLTLPNNPPCASCGSSGPGVQSTFITSVNQGGSGYIHDLKLVNDANTPSSARVLNSGYTLLNSDLNKGAAGAYIYLCFQRNASSVLNGLEYYQGQPYSGPNEVLTNFQTQLGSLTNKPTANSHFFDIWLPNQNPYPYWSTQDLNAGAGGNYIYSYQSKTPSVIVPGSSVTTLWPPIAEVGILSGNSSTINPPTGWTKYQVDLNEGAGGDYIYLCYR